MAGSSGVPVQAVLYNWMVFIDGENFTIQGHKLAQQNNIALKEGSYYNKDAFLWIPDGQSKLGFNIAQELRRVGRLNLAYAPIRQHYYASVVGNDVKREEIRSALWEIGFQPIVFKKNSKSLKTKGVDIALTKDLLTNAFLGNYDVAILITGDGDYVPVIEEVKRLGKVVNLVFFGDNSLNHELKICCDSFMDISEVFIDLWKKYSTE